ncbi:MAG: PEP-CTERM sorting domain-containing protein [Phycisphaerae bacterium]|nr:PEP-CTERM sorting domain-containing protein [Phycisphaerae bacterium]
MNINLTANVNISASFQCGLLKFKGAVGITTTLNQAVEATLICQKAGSSELLALSNAGCTGSMYQSAGTVYVRQSTTGGLTTVGENGQLRLVGSAAVGASGYYYLEGGLLEAQIINKGDKTRNGNFVGSGGTLAILNTVAKFGMLSENVNYGFRLGSTLYAAGGVLRVSSTRVGTDISGAVTGKDDFLAQTGTLEFDVADCTAHYDGTAADLVTQLGQQLIVENAKLKVNALPGLVITDPDWYWDVWRFTDDGATASEGRYGGDFANVNLPAGWWHSWENLIDDARVDTLRIHVPEPATLALLVMGGSALLIRRKR